MNRLMCVVGITLVSVIVLLPAKTSAQDTTGISGVVRDATGAVLPGVTVEASSPALIEKVRTATTDGAGQYKIIDLRPGVYAVTFTLAGFGTVRREGIELTDGFTATVNAEVKVGNVEETITVTGASPVVDVQTVNQQKTLTRDILDSVPMGKRYQNMGNLIPGVVSSQRGDVGGAFGNGYILLTVHGSATRDQTILVDGLNISTAVRNDVGLVTLQDSTTEQYSFQTAAQSAEMETSGVRVNLIPRDGGNTFKGFFTGFFMNSSMQAYDLTPDLLARGLGTPNKVKSQWEVNPAYGGPILRDRVWFFTGVKQWTTENYIGGGYFNATPNTFRFTPDYSRPSVDDSYGTTGSLRLTVQATSRNKLSVMEMGDYTCNCHLGITTFTTPEAASRTQVTSTPVSQLTWTAPLSERFLVEMGASSTPGIILRDRQPGVVLPQITEASSGIIIGASNQLSNGPTGNREDNKNINLRGSASYVTGTHNLKVGFNYLYMDLLVHRTIDPEGNYVLGQESFTLLNGSPLSVTYYANPSIQDTYTHALGIYAQDQWTLRRLTATAGLRLDSLHSGYGAVDIPASNLVPERNFASGQVFNWKDWSPRMGAVYDLFGNGKTAVKVSLNRYIGQQGPGITDLTNPAALTATSGAPSTRTWTDLNRDFVVQGDPTNPAANGELGKASNTRFGQVTPTTTYDPAWESGWGKRPYNWETSAGFQHELRPGMSVNAAYFRRSYGNFVATFNRATSPSDYDPYCITTPVDARLPGGGGQTLCGLYDVTPAKFGQINNYVTPVPTGTQSQTWNGYDFTMTARVRGAATLQGGLSSGKTVLDNCAIAAQLANPISLFCHTEEPMLTQFKFFGLYPLPWWGLQVGGSFTSSPGAPVLANYVATNASIVPSLGRNLAAGQAATVTVNLVATGQQYLERLNQFDLRGTKTFWHAKAMLNLDAYNLLNTNTVLSANNTYGTTGTAWLTPTGVLPGRLFKVSASLNF